jgi:hypothetical protein
MVNQSILHTNPTGKEGDKPISENPVRNKVQNSSLYDEKCRNSIADALSYFISQKKTQ